MLEQTSKLVHENPVDFWAKYAIRKKLDFFQPTNLSFFVYYSLDVVFAFGLIGAVLFALLLFSFRTFLAL